MADELESQIKSIFQFCIRQIDETKFSLVFIYLMSDDKYSRQDFELNLEQTMAYMQKKGWLEMMPRNIGQTVQVVRAGEVIRDLGKKYQMSQEELI